MNEKLIDGRFYDDQYTDINSEYYRLYITEGIQNRAIEINQHYVDFAIWFYGLRPGASVLEAGCGVGHKIQSWNERGFKCRGIEVSKEARRLSNYRDQIDVGNVSDMSMYPDDEFDLVFSHGLMEHIHGSVLEKTIAEQFRVGVRQFHIISIDKGVDPGHIQVLTSQEWADVYLKDANSSKRANLISTIPDFIQQEHREVILVASPWGILPWPVRKYVENKMVEKQKSQEKVAI